MIEVFKTNIQERSQAERLLSVLRDRFPGHRINVDLHDCDKVLRIEGYQFAVASILSVVHEQGFYCSVLDE